MAFTVDVKERIKIGHAFMVVADVKISKYTTGGEILDKKTLGLNTFISVTAPPAGGYLFEFLPATKALKAYTTGAGDAGDPGAQLASNSTAIKDIAIKIVAIGI